MTRFVALATLLLGLCSALDAAPRNPAAFTSLGTLAPVVSGGTITINTGATPPTMSGGATFNGVVDNGVAVFCFDEVNVPAGVTLSATGSRPLAILSQGDFYFAGVITAIGQGTTPGPGGYAGAIAPGSTAAGPGAGTGGQFGGGSGGGFGGAGGSVTTTSSFAAGGSPYGDLLSALNGGSGGGRSSNATTPTPPADGGGGGGAVELGAAGTMTIDSSGSVSCKGTVGAAGFYGGGGGAGGGILVHGASGTVAGVLDVSGGDGGQTAVAYPGGGGGGGGRIYTQSLAITGNLLATGGLGATGASGSFGANGASGSITSTGAGSGPLDPAPFTSLGTFAPTAAVNIDTGAAVTNPTMSGGATFTGVYTSGGIAVFCFDDVDVQAGVTITVTGLRPLAILSKADFDFAGTLNANGSGTTAGPGGYDGATAPGNGFGPGAGVGGQNGAGAGGFGGNGGMSGYGAPGGTSYGNLLLLLQGGSGGANSQFGTTNGQGGGGGGAIEFGATGVLTVGGSAQINVKGANGGLPQGGSSPQGEGGGAGAGGAVLLHGASGTVAGSLDARGGWGGDCNIGLVVSTAWSGGGGGAGGRIHTINLSVTGSLNVNGGPGGPDVFYMQHNGQAGAAGVISSSTAGAQLSVSTSTLSLGSTNPGTPGGTMNYQVSGVDTTASTTVTAPADVEVSLNQSTWGSTVTITTTGTWGPTDIYTRIAASATSSISGDITHTTTGAAARNVAVTGTINSAPVITSTAPTTATVGVLYQYQVTTTGSPTPQLSLAGQPAWLSLNGNIVEGTPSASDVGANGPFTLTATNSQGTDSEQITITVMDAAEIELDDPNGGALADGGSFSGATGTAVGITTTYTFTVHNIGTQDLTVGTPQVTSGSNCAATLSAAPAGTVTPGTNTTFSVDVSPVAAGAWDFSVSFANNDSNEDPYDFTVDGNAAGAPAPEIEVEDSSGAAIAVGATVTATSSGAAGVTMSLSYTIRNTGSMALSIGNVQVTAGGNSSATLASSPSASVSPGGSSSFDVDVTPAAAGAWTFNVSVANSDANEDPYTFSVNGNASGAPSAEIELLRGSNPVADGGADGLGGIGGSGTTVTYVIRNTGTAALNLTGTPEVAIGNEVNCTVVVTAAPSVSLAPGASTNFVLSVLTAAGGSFSFTVSLDNDDANENPYNFQVSGNTGGSTGAPGGGGSGGGGGCSAMAGQNWAALVGLFAMIAVRIRRRK